MADVRPSLLARIETALRGWVHTDDPTLGSGRFDLGTLNGMLATRRTSDVLYSDGATAGGQVSWPLGAPGNLATSPLSFGGRFEVLSNSSTGIRGMLGISNSQTSSGAAQSIGFYREGNSLRAVFFGATTGDFRRLTSTTAVFSTLSLGFHSVVLQWDRLAAPTLYIDGQAVATTEDTSGTAPLWTSALNSVWLRAFAGASAERYEGAGRDFFLINGVLTAAELLAWTQTGRLPTWCETGTGSAVAKYTSNFSGGADSWTADAPIVVTGNVDSINGQDDWLQVERQSSTGALYSRSAAGNSYAGMATVGKKYRFSARVFIPAGTPITHIQFYADNGATLGPAVSVAANTQYDISAELPCSANQLCGIRVCNSAGTATASVVAGTIFYTKSWVTHELAPIIKPVIQPCRVLDDAGANGIPGILTAGITPLTSEKRWRIRAAVDMSSTGNKQLLSAALFETPQNQALDSIDVECAGAPTFSVGDGTTATKYTASTAYTAGRSRTAIASPFPADSAKTGVYANVTVSHASATAEKITICGHRTD